MKTESPPTRRMFRTPWDEIEYLRAKILYWFYQRQDRPRALRFADRLEKLLAKAAADHEAIVGEECWSLLWETRGDLGKAILYRQSEIEKINRLRAISSHSPASAFVLQGYGIRDLSDRLDLLAILYHDAGDLEKAIQVLHDSKELCQAHAVRFDGRDLLREYSSEKKGLAVLDASPGETARRNLA